MNIAIGCDHAGFPLKASILAQVQALGHRAIDCGTCDEKPVDYPDIAAAVAKEVTTSRAERGIVICGSGVGAAVAANKVVGIRAGLCHDSYSARQGVEHDDVNVLCLGARVIGSELAADIVRNFLAARFTGEERHRRRLNKILAIEAAAKSE